ncbi:MAG: flagellar hook-basal body complex protein FliE [Pirellulaceae bacterium]
MQISPTNMITSARSLKQVQAPAAKSANDSFGGLVKDFIAQTNQDQIQSDQAISDLVSGKTDNVQDVVLATAKAEMSFQLFMEIRNQMVAAYNELMRMQF